MSRGLFADEQKTEIKCESKEGRREIVIVAVAASCGPSSVIIQSANLFQYIIYIH